MLEWGYYITTTSDEASLQWRGGDGWLGGISDEQSTSLKLIPNYWSHTLLFSLMLQKHNK